MSYSILRWVLVLVLLVVLKHTVSSNQHLLQSSKSVKAESKSVLFSEFSLTGAIASNNSIEQGILLSNDLEIDPKFLFRLVDELFYQKHPELNQRHLTNASDPAEAKLRSEWNAIAEQIGNRLAALSVKSHPQLGHYQSADYDRWLREAHQYHLSQAVINHLADARFYHLFPEQERQQLNSKTLGQIWFAVVEEVMQAIRIGTIAEFIEVGSSSRSNINYTPSLQHRKAYKACTKDRCKIVRSSSLKPGDSRVYVIWLNQDQLIQSELQENQQGMLTVYTPSSNQLFRKPLATTQTESIPESGFYKFVVTSNSSEQTHYNFSLIVEEQMSIKPLDFTGVK